MWKISSRISASKNKSELRLPILTSLALIITLAVYVNMQCLSLPMVFLHKLCSIKKMIVKSLNWLQWKPTLLTHLTVLCYYSLFYNILAQWDSKQSPQEV